MRTNILTITAAVTLTAAVIIAGGCRKQQRLDTETDLESEPASGTEILPAAADSFEPAMLIGGEEVRLEAYLWRDFMPGPGAPADGHRLRGVVRVFSVDGQRINGEIDIEYVWLKHNDSLWGVALPAPAPVDPPSRVEKSFAGGPEWPTGTPVAVIVKLVDRKGLPSYLRVNDIEIVKTQ